MVKIARIYLGLFAVVFLAGCSQGPGTIFKQFQLGNDGAATTGARQRVIIANEPSAASRPGLVTPRRIVCTEPSPDVALAMASSFAVGVSVLGQGSGSLAKGEAEGIAQLAERTITIQLLREQMYRACEAYANGAVTGTTYTLILSKLNDTMVTLMLGETAGGAFGRAGAAIGAKAEAKASASMSGMQGAMGDIDQNAGKLAAANQELQDKQKLLDAAKEKESNPSAGAGPAVLKKNTADAEKARDKAKLKRDATAELLQGSIDTAAKAAGEITKVVGVGGLTAKPDAETARVLADMQHSFLFSDSSQNYVSACLVELGMGNENLGIDEKFHIKALGDLQANPPNGYADLPWRTTFLASNLTRQSGLYRHCRTHLATFVREAHRSNVALRGRTLDIRMKQFDVAQEKLRESATKEKAKIIAACSAQTDQAKKDCFASLSKLEVPARRKELLSALLSAQPVTADDAIAALITFAQLEAANAALGMHLMELTNTPVSAAPSGAAKSVTNRRSELDNNRSALRASAPKVIANVKSEINGKKTAITTHIETQSAAIAALRDTKEELAIAVQQKKVELSKAILRQTDAELRKLHANAMTETRKIVTLKKQIDEFNAGLAKGG